MKRKKPIRKAPRRSKRGRPLNAVVEQREVVRHAAILELAEALVEDSIRKRHDTLEIRNRLRWAFPGLVHANDSAIDDWIRSWNLQPQKVLVATVKAQ